jgi:glyoxylase-like metal-dependent hydrolase (beta-lactamase superfamily II)
MDCTVIAHEKTAQTFRARPSTFKAQGDETGAEWEKISGMGSIRWAPPEISFAQDLTLHWGEGPVLLEHHPGPTAGAVWVILPEEKIVFIGDTVLKGQPPFLASADLDDWIESINLLLKPAFKRYTIVSSRGGTVNAQAIRNQLDFLKYARDRLEKMAARHARPETTEKLIQPLLEWFRVPASRQKSYAQRLRFGLLHYYIRHYHPSRSSHVD